ncbi:hypothetical protein [Mesorhizobium sp. B263B2A]|uniref:hypothetical protein n=1 Tax=Mesorhizobium sp. B263B2A TaxID=2876669 RepID=UPI001CD0F2EB|nr:hypothetical protein [Mesorhizobium sp. B263B2A]MCA0029271.1 hypothetical protein [Mesorhizobium sp. B263B2A]
MFVSFNNDEVNLDNVKFIRKRYFDKKFYFDIDFIDGASRTFESHHDIDLGDEVIIPAPPGFLIIGFDLDGSKTSSEVIAFKIPKGDSHGISPKPVTFDGITGTQYDSVLQSPSGKLFSQDSWYDSIERFEEHLKNLNQ